MSSLIIITSFIISLIILASRVHVGSVWLTDIYNLWYYALETEEEVNQNKYIKMSANSHFFLLFFSFLSCPMHVQWSNLHSNESEEFWDGMMKKRYIHIYMHETKVSFMLHLCQALSLSLLNNNKIQFGFNAIGYKLYQISLISSTISPFEYNNTSSVLPSPSAHCGVTPYTYFL